MKNPNNSIKNILLGFLILVISDSIAQEQQTFENINTGDQGSLRSTLYESPDTGFVEFNGKLFFYATTPEYGKEIWYSDGSSNGAQLLIDNNPGSFSNIGSRGYDFDEASIIFNNELYFVTGDGLWKSDGTQENTIKLKELKYISKIVKLSEETFIFYLLGDGVSTLWKSDGTAAGTVQIFDFKEEFGEYTDMRTPKYFGKTVNNKLFFVINSIFEKHLWVTDGTTSGTIRLFRGKGDFIKNPEILNNELFIVYTDGFLPDTRDLLKTDGTLEGTKIVLNLSNSTANSNENFFLDLHSANDKLYISLLKGNTYSIIETDGTEAGATEIYSDTATELNHYYSNLNNSDSALIFTSRNAVNQTSLFQFNFVDRTLSEIGSIGNLIRDENETFLPLRIKKLTSNRYFVSEGQYKSFDHPVRSQLSRNKAWMYEIDASSIEEIDNLSGVLDVFEFNNQLYFPKYSDYSELAELWRSDGSNANTELVDDINKRNFGTEDRLHYRTTLQNNLLYSINNRVNDIFSLNTNTLDFDKIIDEDFYASRNMDRSLNGSLNGSPIFQGERYFIFNSEIGRIRGNQIKILKSDGTKAGTVLVENIPFTDEERYITHALTFQDKLYFIEYRLINLFGSKALLTSYDGTEYTIVKDFGEQELLSHVITHSYISDNGFYIVSKSSQVSSQETLNRTSRVWFSDGTAQGTDEYVTDALFPALYKNELYFSGALFRDSNFKDRELMKINATEKRVEIIKDIEINASGKVNKLIANNDLLFFIARTEEHGDELWKTDGTEEGTVLVKDIVEGSDSFFQPNCGDDFFCRPTYTVLQNELYFLGAYSGSLWKTDGTAEGTIELKRRPNSGLTTIGDFVYFSSWDATHGRELWRTDGTVEGTQIALDLSVGSSDSSPIAIAAIGNTIYFSAETNETGRQLWKFVDEVLSVEEQVATTETSFIYPNPTADIIRFKDPERIKNIKVFNMNGTTVLSSKEMNNNGLNVTSLPMGMYMVTYTKDGIQVAQKLMKK